MNLGIQQLEIIEHFAIKTFMNDPARKIFLRNENGDPETKNWTGD